MSEPMETKQFDELKPDPKNPRKMSDHDGAALSNSVTQFGDLACIVFNVKTQQMVAGHQRTKIFERLPAERRITISERAEQGSYLDEVGTVAYGYIWIGNKQFAYREVDWEPAKQKAANIAANRIQGSFDLDLLAEANQFLLEQGETDLLASTGQTDEEVEDLLKMSGTAEQKPEDAPKEPPMVIRIECESDQQMSDLYKELQDRGLKVRVI